MREITTEQTSIYQEDEMVEISIAYPADNDEYYEISGKAFEHSSESLREGQTDILIFFCGIISLVFFFVVLITSLSVGVSPFTVVLLALYVITALVCFIKPLQVFIAKRIWNGSFSKKLMVNEGCDDKVMLSIKAMYYTNPEGEEIRVAYDDMDGLYCTNTFLIFELDKKNMCAIKMEELYDEAIKKTLMVQVEECLLSKENIPDALETAEDPEAFEYTADDGFAADAYAEEPAETEAEGFAEEASEEYAEEPAEFEAAESEEIE